MATVPSDVQDEDYDKDYEEDHALAHYEGRPIHAFSKQLAWSAVTMYTKQRNC